jgi:hypothetical protein
LIYGQNEALSVTGGSTNGAVTYSLIGGPCTISGGRLTANSGTGTCQLAATMAGSTNYNAVTSAPANTVPLAQASQTITFTTGPYATAAYTSTFWVAASSTSGGTVTFTSAGACTNSGATYTVTSATGTCSVIASQAGSSNYAAIQVTKAVPVASGTLVVAPSTGNFGSVAVGQTSPPISFTVTNGTTSAMGYLGYANLGEFYLQPGTCHLVNGEPMLNPGKSCVFTAVFKPTKAGPANGNLSIQTSFGTFNVPMKGTTP